MRDLSVEFRSQDQTLRPVDSVSYELRPGETLGIVGESGSGKTTSVLALLGLLPELRDLHITGDVQLDGRDLLRMSSRQRRRMLGAQVGVIFQDPLTSLNPVLTVGRQITEVIEAHTQVNHREAQQRAIDLLELVGIPQPDARVRQYPHELSGGLRQRVMIAIAIANRPALLIADEATTALDVTIQAQVIEVFRQAKTEIGAAAIVISHDLGVIAELADHVLVMYAGRVIESGPVDVIFNVPRHPYTSALLACRPRLEARTERLASIPGRPPELTAIPSGCPFHPRCPLGADKKICAEETPQLRAVGDGHHAACHFAEEVTRLDHANDGREAAVAK